MYKSEAHLQSECYKWFCSSYPGQRNRYFLIYNNPPNGVVASMLKSMGLNRGISDSLYFPPAKERYFDVWFEFKLEGETQSDPQKEFADLVTNRGHEYYLIQSLEEFQKIMVILNKQ